MQQHEDSPNTRGHVSCRVWDHACDVTPTSSKQSACSFKMSQHAAAHMAPRGYADARPTAAQIVRDENLVGRLRGKVVLITGANSSGISLEYARALHLAGCDVFLTVRDRAKAQAVQRELSDCTGSGKLEVLQLELDSLAAVKEGAEAFLARSDKLNVLIANAGTSRSFAD